MPYRVFPQLVSTRLAVFSGAMKLAFTLLAAALTAPAGAAPLPPGINPDLLSASHFAAWDALAARTSTPRPPAVSADAFVGRNKGVAPLVLDARVAPNTRIGDDPMRSRWRNAAKPSRTSPAARPTPSCCSRPSRRDVSPRAPP